MIEINYNPDFKDVEIRFSGDNFSRFKNIFNARFIFWNKKRKAYICSPGMFLILQDELENVEDFIVPPETLSLIEETKFGNPVTNFTRRAFDISLLKMPPLAEYQIQDIKKMISQNRLINGLEVGLGKSFEFIGAMNHLINAGEIEKIFIVTVPETVYNWKRELLKFSWVNKEEILIVNKDNRDIISQWADKKVIIMSYLSFLLVSDYYYKEKNNGKKSTKYRTPSFDFSEWGKKLCIVLDEGHKIKDTKTRSFKVLKLYKEKFEYRYILTATPYPNHIGELWPLINFIDEGVLGDDYDSYLETVAELGSDYSRLDIKSIKPEEVIKVVDRIKPFFIRRFKKDCLPNLPPLNIKKIYAEPSPDFSKIYEGIIIKKLSSMVEVKGEYQTKEVIRSFPYLTLACSEPTILKDKLTGDIDFDTILKKWKLLHNPKLEICDNLLSNIPHDKKIIWSTHPVTIDLLANYYKKENPFVMHGETKTDGMSKDEFKDRFLEEFRFAPDRKLAIISPLCLGTGQNIEFAETAISWDRNYSSITWQQSLGRNHRATSINEVNHYVLIMDNTLEVIQDEVLEGKVNLNNKLLLKDQISSEEWVEIFHGVSNKLKK